MKNRSNLFLLLTLITLWSCTAPASEQYDAVALTQEVSIRLDAFVTGLNSGSAAGLPDFYSQDERFYWVEDGRISYPNHQALANSLTGLYESLESAEMTVLDRKIEMLDASNASIYSEYEQKLKLRSGYEFSINGAMTALMHKEDGVWRFLIGHSSTKKQRGG